MRTESRWPCAAGPHQAPPPPSPPGSPLDGNELQAIFARPPGPWLRRIKLLLDQAVQTGTLAPDDKTGAVQLAAQELEAEDAAIGDI